MKPIKMKHFLLTAAVIFLLSLSPISVHAAIDFTSASSIALETAVTGQITDVYHDQHRYTV